jgi:hypothetical protein
MLIGNEAEYVGILKKLKVLKDAGFTLDGKVEQLNSCDGFDPSNSIIRVLGKDGEVVFETPRALSDAQLRWYETKSPTLPSDGSFKSLFEKVKPDKYGYTNSNYGACVYGLDDRGKSQFDYACEAIESSKYTNRSVIIYTGPDMQHKYRNDDGLNDFRCTMYTHLMVRPAIVSKRFNEDEEQLHYFVRQRSCDVFSGMVLDFRHHCQVYWAAFDRLRKSIPNLKKGRIFYVCDSLHCYERDFGMLDYVVDNGVGPDAQSGEFQKKEEE